MKLLPVGSTGMVLGRPTKTTRPLTLPSRALRAASNSAVMGSSGKSRRTTSPWTAPRVPGVQAITSACRGWRKGARAWTAQNSLLQPAWPKSQGSRDASRPQALNWPTAHSAAAL